MDGTNHGYGLFLAVRQGAPNKSPGCKELAQNFTEVFGRHQGHVEILQSEVPRRQNNLITKNGFGNEPSKEAIGDGTGGLQTDDCHQRPLQVSGVYFGESYATASNDSDALC